MAEMEVSKKLGLFVESPQNKDYDVLRSMLAPPVYGNPQMKHKLGAIYHILLYTQLDIWAMSPLLRAI